MKELRQNMKVKTEMESTKNEKNKRKSKLESRGDEIENEANWSMKERISQRTKRKCTASIGSALRLQIFERFSTVSMTTPSLARGRGLFRIE